MTVHDGRAPDGCVDVAKVAAEKSDEEATVHVETVTKRHCGKLVRAYMGEFLGATAVTWGASYAMAFGRA